MPWSAACKRRRARWSCIGRRRGTGRRCGRCCWHSWPANGSCAAGGAWPERRSGMLPAPPYLGAKVGGEGYQYPVHSTQYTVHSTRNSILRTAYCVLRTRLLLALEHGGEELSTSIPRKVAHLPFFLSRPRTESAFTAIAPPASGQSPGPRPACHLLGVSCATLSRRTVCRRSALASSRCRAIGW